MQPPQIAAEYRCRFGIETSYRLMNKARARTTCKKAEFCLFLVFLLNMWAYVKWSYLFVPEPGPRVILPHLLPFDQWRAWLWSMTLQPLRLSLSIPIPMFS